MSLNIPIPAATVPVSTLQAPNVYGWAAVPTGLADMKIVIDVGSLSPAQTISVYLDRSDDGGTTTSASGIAVVNRPGGNVSDDDGSPDNNLYIGTHIGGDPNNVLRSIRARVVVGVSFHTNGGSLTAT